MFHYLAFGILLSCGGSVATDVDYITFHNCTVIVAYGQVNSVISGFIIYVYRVLLS